MINTRATNLNKIGEFTKLGFNWLALASATLLYIDDLGDNSARNREVMSKNEYCPAFS